MGIVANSQGLRWSLLSSTVWSRARNLEDGVSFVLFPGKHREWPYVCRNLWCRRCRVWLRQSLWKKYGTQNAKEKSADQRFLQTCLQEQTHFSLRRQSRKLVNFSILSFCCGFPLDPFWRRAVTLSFCSATTWFCFGQGRHFFIPAWAHRHFLFTVRCGRKLTEIPYL